MELITRILNSFQMCISQWAINNGDDLLVHRGHADKVRADFGHVLWIEKLNMKQCTGEQAEQKQVDRHASQPRQVDQFVNEL